VLDLRAKLRAATADDHRRTEESFAAFLTALPHSYGDFLQAHARAFPAIGRALSAGLDWPAWRQRWHDLESDLAAFDLDPPPALNITAAAGRAEALGMVYVLEGSRLGSSLLHRRIPAGLPAAYLRGGNDRTPWLLLLAQLETVGRPDQAAAIAGARTAFGAFRAAAALQPAARALEPVP
jgi:heme oxygenase